MPFTTIIYILSDWIMLAELIRNNKMTYVNFLHARPINEQQS